MNKRFLFTVFKFILLLIIVVGIPAYLVIFQRDFLLEFKSFDDILAFLEKNKAASIFTYIMIQSMQIIISIIPGQAFQFAAGYLYTFIPALLFSLIGAVLGTSVSFWLARILGKDFVHMLIDEKKIESYVTRLNSRRAYSIVFLLYLIPGLPKDILSYIAGLSEMDFRNFLLVSVIGRTPAMACSLLIGDLFMHGHYYIMVMVAGLVLIIVVICIIKRKSILKRIDNIERKKKEC